MQEHQQFLRASDTESYVSLRVTVRKDDRSGGSCKRPAAIANPSATAGTSSSPALQRSRQSSAARLRRRWSSRCRTRRCLLLRAELPSFHRRHAETALQRRARPRSTPRDCRQSGLTDPARPGSRCPGDCDDPALVGRPLRLTVRRGSGRRAQGLLDRYGACYRTVHLRDRTSFTIANPGGSSADAHPFAASLGRDLRRLGVDVVAYVVP
jgi:hypothetical protein